MPNVCVLVLGDIGRSPRIQYHAVSLAANGFQVDLVGFQGSTPMEAVLRNDNVQLRYLYELPRLPAGLSKAFYPIYAVFKVILQVVLLIFTLVFLVRRPSVFLVQVSPWLSFMTMAIVIFNGIKPPRTSVIARVLVVLFDSSHLGKVSRSFPCPLIQNPPSIPTLAIVRLVSWVVGAGFVVDWHNFGYTILSLSRGEQSPMVRFAKWYEHLFGKLADQHLCVTKAMRRFLVEEWGFSAESILVLYDRAPAHFKKLALEERHRLFFRLQKEDPAAFAPTEPTVHFDSDWYESSSSSKSQSRKEDKSGSSNEPRFPKETTMISERDIYSGVVRYRSDRPVILVSGTSWTEDEDFSVLLNALVAYDADAHGEGIRQFSKAKGQLPKLVCIITGKGPMKEYYLNRIKEMNLTHVEIRTAWLAPADYPRLLGSADCGISLHKSSSGLDLPMKVVDMFGAGLPVFAIGFQCIDELVNPNKNGFIFSDSEELCSQLEDAFADFDGSKGSVAMQNLAEGVESFRARRWEDNWNRLALPLFQRYV